MRWWRWLLARARARRGAAEAVEARESRVRQQNGLMIDAARGLAALPTAERARRLERALRVQSQHPLVEHIEASLGKDGR